MNVSAATGDGKLVERRSLSAWALEHPIAYGFDLELTERCNNNCVHCYINVPADDAAALARELSAAEIIDILYQAASLGAMTVRMTGGEPLLREDFAEIYRAARRLGVRVKLYTNACLMTPEIAALLAEIPPGEPVEVTCYGITEDSYEAITRTPGSFSAFLGGIELLAARAVPFGLKTVVLPPNRDEIAELDEWVERHGAVRLPTTVTFLELRGRRDSDALNRTIERMRFAPEDVVELQSELFEEYEESMSRFCTRFMGVHGDELFSCGAGNRICVDAYGRAQACMLLRHPDTTYDLRQGTLRKAVTEFLPGLHELRAENETYLRRCAHCFLGGLCEQCPARSWSEHGNLDTPVEYHCDIAHAQARHLGLLAEGERAWEVEDWRERIDSLRAALESRHGR